MQHGQARHGRPQQAGTAPEHPSRFEVLISHDGAAALNGERILVPEGEMVHIAVLDAMQRHAQALNAPVEASVLDRRGNYGARVQVSPDGSSQLLDYEGGPDPARKSSPRELENLEEFVTLINGAVTSGDLAYAARLSTRLRDHASHHHGAEHAHTLRAHEIEAYIAYLNGDHPRSTSISLTLARIRHRQGEGVRAREDVKRAVTTWWRIGDTQAALSTGRDLVGLWHQLAVHGGPSAADAELLHRVERHLEGLTTGAGDLTSGAGGFTTGAAVADAGAA